MAGMSRISAMFSLLFPTMVPKTSHKPTNCWILILVVDFCHSDVVVVFCCRSVAALEMSATVPKFHHLPPRNSHPTMEEPTTAENPRNFIEPPYITLKRRYYATRAIGQFHSQSIPISSNFSPTDRQNEPDLRAIRHPCIPSCQPKTFH